MKRFLKILLGLGILLAGVGVTALLWITRPEAEKKDNAENIPVMKVMAISPASHAFTIPSQGIIEPDKRSRIAAEVAGRVLRVSENFEAGMLVGKGLPEATDIQPLVEIDPTNYLAAIEQAKSALADAESALATEEARAEQAKSDWKKLGRSGEPPALVQRLPQLKSARARRDSAQAALAQAEADLARTKIRPPYEAIVASTMTEVGNYLTPGSPVAEIYATAPYEVRLPLSIDESRFLETTENGAPTGKVQISATAGGKTRTWEAKIIRSEGEIDRATRSLFIVVEVEDSSEEEGVELRPGLFVKAAIAGRSQRNLAAIPFQAFRDLDTVVVVDPDNKIQFRDVTVIRREGDAVYVDASSFNEEDRVSLTEMPDLVRGMQVEPDLVPSPLREDEEEVSPNTAASTEP